MNEGALPFNEITQRPAPSLAAGASPSGITGAGPRGPRLERPLWHQAAVACVGHGVLLALAIWVARVHLPPPPPEPLTITLVSQSTPEGAPVAQPAPVQPPRPPVPAPPVPAPPRTAPAPAAVPAAASVPVPGAAPAPPAPLAPSADLPLPPPAPPQPAPQVQVAKALAHPPAPPPAAVRQAAGAKIKALRLASATVAVLHPAAAMADNQAPDYPLVARMAGEKGTVRFELYLDATGTVTRYVMTQSSGFAMLDDSVRATALTWRYRPAERQGVAVASVVPFHVTFDTK